MGIRSIYFRAKIVGRGIVNYDSKDSVTIVRRCFPEFSAVFNNNGKQAKNIMLAKHEYTYKTDSNGNRIKKTFDNGDEVYECEAKVKISAECLRSHILGDDFPFHNNDIVHAPTALVKLLASPANLLKGHMFTIKDDSTLKRKSPVNTCDAVQTSETHPNFEVHSARVPKNRKKSNDDEGNTSLYYKESVGDIEYLFEGSIDIDNLQFISLSNRYDRMAVHPDHVEFFIKNLSKNLGSEVSDWGWYQKKTAVNELPEEGILLSQEQCLFLVKEFLKRLMSLRIEKTKAYARVEDVKIMYLKDPLNDNPSNESNYHSISSIKDIKVKPSDLEVFYNQVSEEDAVALYDNISDSKASAKEVALAKKAAKKTTKKKTAKKENILGEII